MARDVNGNYALPAGNPVVGGTPITTSWANATLNDLASELTDSFSRSDKGAFTGAQMRVPPGTGSAAPGVGFRTETGSGLGLIAGAVQLIKSGVAALSAAASGVTITGVGADGGAVPGLWVNTANAISNTASRLLRVSNNLVEKFAVFPDGSATFAGPVAVGVPTASNHAMRKDSALERSALPASNFVASPGSGIYAVTGSMADVTSVSLSLTTIGRPVLLMVVPASGSGQVQIASSGSSAVLSIKILRDASTVGIWNMQLAIAGNMSVPPAILHLDSPAASTYTYKLQAQLVSGTGATISNVALVAFEL